MSVSRGLSENLIDPLYPLSRLQLVYHLFPTRWGWYTATSYRLSMQRRQTATSTKDDDDDDEGMTTGRVGSRGANVMPRRFSRETIRDAMPIDRFAMRCWGWNRRPGSWASSGGFLREKNQFLLGVVSDLTFISIFEILSRFLWSYLDFWDLIARQKKF